MTDPTPTTTELATDLATDLAPEQVDGNVEELIVEEVSIDGMCGVY